MEVYSRNSDGQGLWVKTPFQRWNRGIKRCKNMAHLFLTDIHLLRMWTNYLRDVLTRLSLMKRQIFWTYVATQSLPLILTKLSRRSRREKELKLRRTKGTRKSTLEAPYLICLSFFRKFLKVDKYRYIYDIRYEILRQPNLRNTTLGFLSTQPTPTARSAEMSYLTSPTSFSWSTASRVRTEFRFGVFSYFVKIWHSYQLIFS